jgi:hypothetical protein
LEVVAVVVVVVVVIMSQLLRGVRRIGFVLFQHWDHGFESRSRYECALVFLCVVLLQEINV